MFTRFSSNTKSKPYIDRTVQYIYAINVNKCSFDWPPNRLNGIYGCVFVAHVNISQQSWHFGHIYLYTHICTTPHKTGLCGVRVWIFSTLACSLFEFNWSLGFSLRTMFPYISMFFAFMCEYNRWNCRQ